MKSAFSTRNICHSSFACGPWAEVDGRTSFARRRWTDVELRAATEVQAPGYFVCRLASRASGRSRRLPAGLAQRGEQTRRQACTRLLPVSERDRELEVLAALDDCLGVVRRQRLIAGVEHLL